MASSITVPVKLPMPLPSAVQFSLVFGLLCLIGPGLGLDLQQVLVEGDAAVSRGEYTAAVRFYTDAIEADPTAALLYTKRAAAYLSLRQHSQALRDLDRAVEADDKYVQGYLMRGKVLRQTCRLEAAQKDFETVLQIKPNMNSAVKELETLTRLKGVMEQLRQPSGTQSPEEDKAMLESVYADAPDCGEAQMLEALSHFRNGNYEQVIAVTGRMLKSSPSNLEALVLRGQGYFYLGEHDLAKRHCGEALKLDPDHKPSRETFNKVKEFDRKRQKANKAVEEGKWSEAQDLLLTALEVDPLHHVANFDLWLNLAKTRRQLGDTAGAVEALDHALALRPDEDAAVELRVILLMDEKKWEEAVQVAKLALQSRQQDARFHQLVRDAEKALKISKRKDYFGILGVTAESSQAEIKRAYRVLAVQYHPDKVSPEEKDQSEAMFREVVEAYEVLTNEEKRAAWDQGEDLAEMEQRKQQQEAWKHQQQQGGQAFHFQWT